MLIEALADGQRQPPEWDGQTNGTSEKWGTGEPQPNEILRIIPSRTSENVPLQERTRFVFIIDLT